MAPGYRANPQTRRGNRATFPEQDDLEGLPVRQWRQGWMDILPPPPMELYRKNDRWAWELPRGMPKDWQLLPPHSQDLLRAARSGRLYKGKGEEDEAPKKESRKRTRLDLKRKHSLRDTQKEDQDEQPRGEHENGQEDTQKEGPRKQDRLQDGQKDTDETGRMATLTRAQQESLRESLQKQAGKQAETQADRRTFAKKKTWRERARESRKAAKKEGKKLEDGYRIRTWQQVPRTIEVPLVSHLAKRHKSTVTMAAKAIAIQTSGPTITRATIRRIDAAGNPYEQTVTLAEGQQVDGEIISTSIVPVPSARGSELTHQTTPSRRKAPPPRRKGKGVRGRKKKLMPPSGVRPVQANGEVRPVSGGGGVVADESTKLEGDNDAATNQDSEMADHSGVPSDDEEGEEGDEGDEGSEGGDDDHDDETPERENSSLGPDPDHEMEGTPPVAVEAPLAAAADQTMSDSGVEVAATAAAAADGGATSGISRPVPPNPLNLTPQHTGLHISSPAFEGSPLKNVILRSPTEPSPAMSPLGASFSMAEVMRNANDSPPGKQAPPVQEASTEEPLDVEMADEPAAATAATATTPPSGNPDAEMTKPATETDATIEDAAHASVDEPQAATVDEDAIAPPTTPSKPVDTAPTAEAVASTSEDGKQSPVSEPVPAPALDEAGASLDHPSDGPSMPSTTKIPDLRPPPVRAPDEEPPAVADVPEATSSEENTQQASNTEEQTKDI